MLEKILVATDGSDNSLRALETAAAIARALRAELMVATAVYVPPSYESDLNPEQKQGIRDAGRQMLEEAGRVLARLGVKANYRVLETEPPAQAIVRLAREGKYELIVLGRRGTSRGVEKTVGSVSDAVLRLADCSVMIVH
ncbi:MAG: universal stress protein [candidate division WOR-3 bacterium]